MDYIVTFLEGLISFISPCMLPLLPVYISYFAGDAGRTHKTFARAVAFVLGFTAVFCMLGIFAGSFGAFLNKYRIAVNIICGIVVILFGLSYMDIIRIRFFSAGGKGTDVKSVFSAFVFGVVFSVSHTPCVGAFLGSAIMMASSSATVGRGVLLLLAYSAGMGIPFLISAVMIDKLVNVFNFIKRHYGIIKIVCGVFLIIVGISMITGIMGGILSGISA